MSRQFVVNSAAPFKLNGCSLTYEIIFSNADRYVILGNHHDAWVFGSIDPLSGTAASTEIIRVLGDLKSTGNSSISFSTWNI